MNVIGTKTCATCKWFFKQSRAPSECHFEPPKTTVLLLGLDARGSPILHHAITRGMTHEGMEACGHHAPKIALN